MRKLFRPTRILSSLFGAFFLGASIFAVSAIGPFADSADFMLVGAFAVLGVFFFVTAFRQSTFRRVVLINVAAAGIAVFTANAYVTYSAVRTAEEHPSSARKELLNIRASGERAYVSLLHADITKLSADRERYSVLRIDDEAVLPMGGVGDVLTLLCKENVDWVTYRADHYGFRNPASAWDGALEIAVVGDSFTQGNCVEDGDHFIDLLRLESPRLLNLGQRGDGPLAGLATIREYAALKKPPLVVWFYFEGNDMPGDFLREIQTPLLRKYLNPNFSQDLMARPVPLSAAFAQYIDKRLLEPTFIDRQEPPSHEMSWLPGREFLKIYRLRTALGFSDFPDTRLVNAYGQVVRLAQDAVKSWRGELALVYLPARRRFESSGARRILERYRRMVRSAAARNDIPFFDMTERFEAQENPLALYDEHYNVRGHAFVAKNIAPFINSLQ